MQRRRLSIALSAAVWVLFGTALSGLALSDPALAKRPDAIKVPNASHVTVKAPPVFHTRIKVPNRSHAIKVPRPSKKALRARSKPG